MTFSPASAIRMALSEVSSGFALAGPLMMSVRIAAAVDGKIEKLTPPTRARTEHPRHFTTLTSLTTKPYPFHCRNAHANEKRRSRP
jgi:hypothetical protein